jgi:hypothetical protein
MKKLQIALLVVLSSAFLTNGANAQNKPLACQEDKSVGMGWESGSWATKNFAPQRFILVQANNTLTVESVAKVFSSSQPFPDQITCRIDPGQTIMCTDSSGDSLFFDPNTLRGGHAKMFGTTNATNRRDTVSVSAFSCIPF